MITKQDILDRASEWNLRANIVEKDYVLGWLLAAFARNGSTSAPWIFKGGTCLKKCFFETYRFSEDLDFTLLPSAAYTRDELLAIIVEVAASAADMSGIQFPADQVTVVPRKDKQGRDTFLAKLAYRGPLKSPDWPKVSFDITAHEPVLAATSARPVLHSYPDHLPEGLTVQCYSLEELFAEKSRALFERMRPRDLYDVVYMSTNAGDQLRPDVARDLFKRKCEVKGKEPPTAAALEAQVRGSAELRADWGAMLGHQLPNLPPIDSVLERLGPAIVWMDVAPVASVAVPMLRSAQLRGEAPPLVAPRGARFWGEAGVPLEVVRFAGMNRLLVSFEYHGTMRLVEPYSLRRPATGNLLLYAWETSSQQIKAFKVREMRAVTSTTTSFVPRYRVELTS